MPDSVTRARIGAVPADPLLLTTTGRVRERPSTTAPKARGAGDTVSPARTDLTVTVPAYTAPGCPMSSSAVTSTE